MESIIEHIYEWRLTIVAGAIPVYLLVCNLLRYQRMNAIARRFNYPTRESLSRMTLNDAHEIQCTLVRYEFPKLWATSLFFALFKTYGIPSISQLLVATSQLSSIATTSKRATDTGILLIESIISPPSSQRAIAAIARINFLHSGYRKAGKISNEDMLYTLSLFALEPANWVAKWEWRNPTMMEMCAVGTFWKALGDAMEIDYSLLPGSKTGFVDGIQFLDELRKWSSVYEDENMPPADTNLKLADFAVDLFLTNCPRILRPAATKIIRVFMGEKLCLAMRHPLPSSLLVNTIEYTLQIRRLVLRYAFPPRPDWIPSERLPKKADSEGRYHTFVWTAYPWYGAKTFWNCWGPAALLVRILGGPVPGDDGGRYISKGYRVEEVGPDNKLGTGEGWMEEEDKGRLEGMDRGGCPFSPPIKS